jgi:hypothetical protein
MRASRDIKHALEFLDVLRIRLENDGINTYQENLPKDAPEWKDAKQFSQV